MSLILEALRKSEAERRRGEAPTLAAELPPATPARRAAWSPWLLPLALCVGIALGAAWWFSERPAPPSTAAQQPATGVAAFPAADAGPDMTEPLPAPRATTAPPAPARPQPSMQVPPSSDDALAPDEAPAPAPASAPDPVATETPMPSAPVVAGVTAPDAPIGTLDGTQRRSLPPLKMSMHLYDDDPARRLVVIDGERLREGQQLGNVLIEQIDPDGVVLRMEGRRVRLPLP